MERLFLFGVLISAGALSASAQMPDPPLDPPLKETDFKHWAFQRPLRPKLATTTNRNPIDHLILKKLDEKGLTLSRPAGQLELLRRVTFDLTGLPPTTEEIDQFLREARSKPEAAYEAVVDRLLASPHYGERWAQHWLDVVRYAESNGYEGDAERPSTGAIAIMSFVPSMTTSPSTAS